MVLIIVELMLRVVLKNFMFQMEIDVQVRYLPAPRYRSLVVKLPGCLPGGFLNYLKEDIVRRITEHFNNVVKDIVYRDFKLGRKVKFKYGQVLDQSRETFEEFCNEIESMNVRRFIARLVVEVNEKMGHYKYRPIEEEQKTEVKRCIHEWFEEFLIEWDGELERNVVKAIEAQHEVKCRRVPGVYNFTSQEIPEELKTILGMGKKAVPWLVERNFTVVKRVHIEVLEYLQKYRRNVQKQPEIQVKSVRGWLEVAMGENETENDKHHRFYSHIYNRFRKALRMVWYRGNISDQGMSVARFGDMSDIPGAVWNEADKGAGLALIPCGLMFSAEEKMMEELGATRMELPANVVVENLDTKVVEFEKSLTGSELNVLNEVCLARRIDTKDVKIPFLKLNAKLHKLTLCEIIQNQFEQKLQLQGTYGIIKC